MKYKGITIHKTKNCNTWYTRFRKDGKQYFISARTQKECYNKLKLSLTNIDHVKPEEQNNYTLEQWYNKWLELYKIGKSKDTTLRDYKSTCNNIPENIWNKDITNITLTDIIETINFCKAPRQKQKLYELLKAVFQRAEDHNIISKNIIKTIDRPKHEKQHGQALTNEQQQELIKICKQIPNSEFLIFAMYQGLRKGEVLGLTWDNVDFKNNTITINKAWNDRNQFCNTKNEQSKRTMPLFEESLKILLNLKNQNCSERIFNISNKDHQTIMEKIKKQTNIEDLKNKDMRSTFMTRCDELGIPERVYQAWVGHKPGSKVTKSVYVKHNTDVDDKYINILNQSKFYSNSTQPKK